jgi:hypothetical protein
VVQQEVICRPLLCVAALVAAVVTSGCSASKVIANRASEIRGRADAIIESTDRLDDTSPDVKHIRSNAVQIRQAVSDIHAVLPAVEDQTPWWASLLGWLAIAGAAIACAWMLTASGALSALRVAIGWLPRRKVAEAEMTAATLSSDHPETLREWVAMKRAADPEFDACWRRAQRGKGTGKQQGNTA